MHKPLNDKLEILNIEKLDIHEVRECQKYLQDILPQLSTPAQKITVLKSKVKLSQRVVELDFERIKLPNKDIAEKFRNYNVW